MKAKELIGMLMKGERREEVAVVALVKNSFQNYSYFHIHNDEELSENDDIAILVKKKYIKQLEKELDEIRRGN